MSEGFKALLGKRKNRVLAIMLAEKDEVSDYLPTAVADELRSVILDQVNDYHDFCVDLLESAAAGMDVNQLALDRLEQVILILENDIADI